MIRFTRILSFEQYVAATKLTLLHTTLSRKLNYILRLQLLPALSAIGLPLSIWQLVRTWNAPGNHAVAFGGWAMVCYASTLFPLTIPLWRRKLRKLYKQQQLNLPWTIEISEQGVRNIIHGQLETRFEWAFFDRYIDSPSLVTIIQAPRASFVAIAKETLSAAEEEELHALLAAHMPPMR